MRRSRQVRRLGLAVVLMMVATAGSAAADHLTIAQAEVFDVSGDVLVIGDRSWEPATEPDSADWGTVYIYYRNETTAGGWELAAQVRSPANTNENFGHSLTIDGDTLAVGAASWYAEGHVYIFERNYDPAAPATPSPDNWGLVKTLDASTSSPDDRNRFASSLDLDGSTLVVGSPGMDGGYSYEGAVFVYERNEGGADNWGEIVFSTSGTVLQDNDNFGTQVAISGRHIMASAPYGPTHAGRVLVFERLPVSWAEWRYTQQLAPLPSPGEADYFGLGALALDGDTAAVGASALDAFCPAANPACGVGAAYVFQLDPVTDLFEQVAFLGVPPPGGNNYGFGLRVALSGENLIVSPSHTTNGVLYHFRRNRGGAGAWGLVRQFAAPGARPGDRFGMRLAIDSQTLVVAGSEALPVYRKFVHLFTLNDSWWQEENKVQHSDASTHLSAPCYDVAIGQDTLIVGTESQASVFSRNFDPAAPSTPSADNWGEMAALPTPSGSTKFGCAVDVDGDYAVVGAQTDYGPAVGTDSGAAYVFFRPQNTTVWHQVAKLYDPNGQDGDQFGAAVAIDGRHIVVGAFTDDIPVSGQPDVNAGGSVVIFEQRNVSDTLVWTLAKKVELVGADLDAFGFFGSSVAISGDRVAVGAWGHTDNAGAAYVLERNKGGADNWGQVKKILASDSGADKQFGLSVDIDDNMLAVGSASGFAYVFERNHDSAAPTVPSADNWGELKRLPSPVASTDFGKAVALDHDRLIVGAALDDDVTADAGAAYIFERNMGGKDAWGIESKLVAATDGATDDLFGDEVAIWQGLAAVAAPGDDDAAANAGSTYLFRGQDFDEADLAVTKSDDGDAPIGGSFAYTIVASNAGPDAAAGATVVDYPAAELTCTWTCAGAGGASCGASGAGHLADAAHLPVGGTATYTLDCAVDGTASGSLDNTVRIWPPLGTSEADVSDNSATESTDLVIVADVGIFKGNYVNEVMPEETMTYEIWAWSFGPGDVSDVTVTDVLPSSLESCTWTCNAYDGASCTASGSGSMSDTATLPAMSSVNYEVTCTVKAEATGSVSNTATANSAVVTDPDPSDNSYNDTDTVVQPGGCGAPDTRDLTDIEIGHQKTYEACMSISASNLQVQQSNGDVTLRAGSWVSFADGFQVENDCQLTVEIDPAMTP